MSETVGVDLNSRIDIIASRTRRKPMKAQHFVVDTLIYIQYSCSNRICKIADQFRSEKFEFTCDTLASNDDGRRNISRMISGMKFPFTMENLHWICGTETTELKDEEDLTEHVLDLARTILGEHNGVSGINLRVVKKITLPVDKFEAMYDLRKKQLEEGHEKNQWEKLLQEYTKDFQFCNDLTRVLHRLHIMGVNLKESKVMEVKNMFDQEEECCICQEEMGNGMKVIKMHCSHLFHPICIFKWLRKSTSRPMCRYNLIPTGH